MSVGKHEFECQRNRLWFVWVGHVGAANCTVLSSQLVKREEDVFWFKTYCKESMCSLFQDKLQNCSHDQFG